MDQNFATVEEWRAAGSPVGDEQNTVTIGGSASTIPPEPTQPPPETSEQMRASQEQAIRDQLAPTMNPPPGLKQETAPQSQAAVDAEVQARIAPDVGSFGSKDNAYEYATRYASAENRDIILQQLKEQGYQPPVEGSELVSGTFVPPAVVTPVVTPKPETSLQQNLISNIEKQGGLFKANTETVKQAIDLGLYRDAQGVPITYSDYTKLQSQNEQAQLAATLLPEIEALGGVKGAIEAGQIDKVRQAIDAGLYTVNGKPMTQLDLVNLQSQIADVRLRDELIPEVAPFVTPINVGGKQVNTLDVVAAKNAGLDASVLRNAGYSVDQTSYDKIPIPLSISEPNSPRAIMSLLGLPTGPIEKLTKYERTIPSQMTSGDVTAPREQNKYYDISAALKDKAITQSELSQLGYSQATIDRAQAFANAGNWQYVPGVGTAMLYPVLTPYERVGRIGGDVSSIASLAVLAANAPSLLKSLEPPQGSPFAPTRVLSGGLGVPYEVPQFAKPAISELFQNPAFVQSVRFLPSEDFASRLLYTIPRVAIAASVASAASPAIAASAAIDTGSILSSSAAIASQLLQRGVIDQQQYERIISELPARVNQQIAVQQQIEQPQYQVQQQTAEIQAVQPKIEPQQVQPQVQQATQQQVTQQQAEQQQEQQVQQQQTEQQIQQQEQQIQQQQQQQEQQIQQQQVTQQPVETNVTQPQEPGQTPPPPIVTPIPLGLSGSGSIYRGGDITGDTIITNLSGQVRDSLTNLPIVKALVRVINSAGAKSQRLTDKNGRYQFTDINPDYYTVLTTKEGYDPIQVRKLVNQGENRLDFKPRQIGVTTVTGGQTAPSQTLIVPPAQFIPAKTIPVQRIAAVQPGVVAVKQGDSGFYTVIYPPYQPNNIVHMKVPPPDALILPNIGSAYKTIVSMGGNGNVLLNEYRMDSQYAPKTKQGKVKRKMRRKSSQRAIMLRGTFKIERLK